MTNEELVTRIQTGEEDLILQLWEQVERLVAWYANRICKKCEISGIHLEYEDLYQSGYLALAAAVPSYRKECSSFSNWFVLHLKTAFAEATGYRSERQRMDPIHCHGSLNSPIRDKDGKANVTVADLVPAPTSDEDPSRDAEMVAVEDAMMYRQLCETVSEAIEELPDNQKDVLHRYYWQGMNFHEIGRVYGVDWGEVQKTERKAIRALRDPKVAMKLRPFLEFNSYSGTGYSSWSHTGSSVEERYVIRKEKLEAEGRGLNAV